MPGDQAYRFEGHSFDIETGDLTGPSGTVRLQPQPAKVLALLLARSGGLVSREELKEAVWPDTVVEADQGLNYCIRQIRSALGDDAEANRFLETLPRRGYRFLIPVEPGVVGQPAIRRLLRFRLSQFAVVIGAMIVFGAVIDGIRSERHRAMTVAVLPFRTEDADSGTVNANRDLTERVVLGLSTVDSLGIIGPATTGRLAGDRRPHPELGRALGADFVISGGIRLADSTLFVQAVRTTDGVHVFAWRRSAVGRGHRELADAVVTAAVPRLSTRVGPTDNRPSR